MIPTWTSVADSLSDAERREEYVQNILRVDNAQELLQSMPSVLQMGFGDLRRMSPISCSHKGFRIFKRLS